MPPRTPGNPDGRRSLTRLEQYNRDRDELMRLPHKFFRLPLTAAGSQDFPFKGNTLSIMRLVGTTPEIQVRFNDVGNDWHRVTSEGEFRGPYDRVWLRWEAIVDGAVDIRFATELY